MNCQPNDLAVVVRMADADDDYRAYTRRIVGRVVRVKKVSIDANGRPVWSLRSPFWLRHKGDRFMVTGIHDFLLQPIRSRADEQPA